MNWFRIDPVAKAIIKSIDEEPERWFEHGSTNFTLGNRSECHSPLILAKIFGDSMFVVRPRIILNLSSQKALRRAYQRWLTKANHNQEEEARASVLAALQELKP